jgi:hypothetical protein
MTQATNGHAPVQPGSVATPFPAPPGDDLPWARRTVPARPATTRFRQVVRDLPSWDPLPPGELLVRRHSRD